ncbi:STAS domain-containing protein [Marinobacterium arenosum]|uniref:STAS domain-containing protein n=1 Tax=Marinobacterium arenosum TaxID=2862496 RepID=UPI001C9560B8|nr:STAS domain-containing protein [Marinobacterium arenosum]MBY4677896.1 STAS domain-containing protein [Marinobacterium arenosum]
MSNGAIFYACQSGRYVLKCVGDVRLTLCSSLDAHLQQVFACAGIEDILIDLTETDAIDSTSLGLIAKLAVKSQQLGLAKPALVSTNEDVTRVLMSMGFDHVFLLLDQLPTSSSDLQALPWVQESDDQVKARIIAAHRVLMGLNESNREAFQDLIKALEC